MSIKNKNVSANVLIVIGFVTIALFGIMSLIVRFVQKEKLTYYKTFNVKISETKTGETYTEYKSDERIETYSIYNINFKSADGQIDTDVVTHSEEYIDYFSQFNPDELTSIPFFKDENNNLFPAMSTETATAKQAEKDYELCYGTQKEMSQYLYVIGGVISVFFFIAGGIMQKKENERKKRETVMNYVKAIKENPENAKEIADDMKGHDIYRKTKARYVAEEYPHSVYSDRDEFMGITETEYLAAKELIRQEKHGISLNDKKGVADILDYESKKNKKY